jgi:hypothetical protein
VDRVAALADLREQQRAVGDELAELLVAVGEDAGHRVRAAEQFAQLRVPVGDGLRQAGQAGKRGAHAGRRVGEGLGDGGERGRELLAVDRVERAGEAGDRLDDVERRRRALQRDLGVVGEPARPLRLQRQVFLAQHRLDADARGGLATQPDAVLVDPEVDPHVRRGGPGGAGTGQFDGRHLADPHAGDPHLVARRQPARVPERGPVRAGGGEAGEGVQVHRADDQHDQHDQADRADDARVALPQRRP